MMSVAAEVWWMVSGKPWTGWRRLAHSAVVPVVVVLVLAKLVS